MKKNKGFTLIELLAIIVILAIIAVITVPIILNVIDNAKRGTAKDSAYGYKDAINKYYVSGMLEDESIKLSGDYNVVDGKLGEYDIPFSGTKPTSGYLTFENNALTSGCLTIDEYKVTFDKGEVTDVEVGECEGTPEQPQVTYKCKRATTLHTEECTRTSMACYDAGYTTGNKGTTITYGNQEVIQGTLTSGDAFDCDVDGNGDYDPTTERFYYVSDLYNTTSKEFDNDYAVLIFYSNFADGKPDDTNSSLVAYNSNKDNGSGINYKGPVTAVTKLPTTLQWKNITLSNISRAILNQIGEGTSGNGSKTLPTGFSYEGYAARLLTAQEINMACNITIGNLQAGQLDNCNYLIENTGFSSASSGTGGYWLETPISNSSDFVYHVNGYGRQAGTDYSYYVGSHSVRPVIEVLKTDIEI